MLGCKVFWYFAFKQICSLYRFTTIQSRIHQSLLSHVDLGNSHSDIKNIKNSECAIFLSQCGCFKIVGLILPVTVPRAVQDGMFATSCGMTVFPVLCLPQQSKNTSPAKRKAYQILGPVRTPETPPRNITESSKAVIITNTDQLIFLGWYRFIQLDMFYQCIIFHLFWVCLSSLSHCAKHAPLLTSCV